MTQELERAISEVRKLPPDQQNAIAMLIMEELEDERQWDEAFARSQDKLAILAERVREDIRAGRVREMRDDDL